MFRSGNATTNDLWSALSKASGQDVHAYMVRIDRSSHFLSHQSQPLTVFSRTRGFEKSGSQSSQSQKNLARLAFARSAFCLLEMRNLRRTRLLGGSRSVSSPASNWPLLTLVHLRKSPPLLGVLARMLSTKLTRTWLVFIGQITRLRVSSSSASPLIY